ncbi:MAG: RsmG family class I SAM-dependent methyltransferase, partial [Burkholderiales bacterium]
MTEDRDSLIAAVTALEVVIDPQTCDRLIRYLALLRKWNRVYNLTAVRDPAEMLTHHLFDSLAVVAPLNRQLA